MSTHRSAPNLQPSLGRALADAIVTSAGQPLPDKVIETTTTLMLDSLGVTVAAHRAPGIAELCDALRRIEPAGGPATLLVDGTGATAATAALVNGAAAHALEFDDTHDEARIHALCTVLPAALAIAQAEGGMPGEKLLRAVALGIEVFCRLGLSCPKYLDRGWHPTTGFGGLAAAAAGSVLLDLDGRGTAHALAIAYAQMCGNTQSIADGALTKRLGPGFAARNGLVAAYLAREGLTGPIRFLDGKSGLFALYACETAAPNEMLDGWAQSWRLLDLSIKAYPCCRCTHGLIELGVRAHGSAVKPDDILEGTLYLGAVNHKIVHAPFEPTSAADPVVHAQFNARYAFARGLMDGRVDLATFDRATILAADSHLAKRLNCEISPSILSDSLPGAAAELRLRDGTTVSLKSDLLLGSPEWPLSRQQLLEKFASTLHYAHATPRAKADRFAQAILELRTAPTLDALFGSLGAVLASSLPQRQR